jgi:CheY-like chemotaxis protein
MKILLVEDNKGDQLILQEAFAESCVECELLAVDDGAQAMEFLNREAPYEKAPRPDLILLDLNLPRKNGFEVLAAIREHADLSHVPVIMLSSSRAQTDICESYHRNASAYLSKPSEYRGFINLARTIQDFWINQVSYCAHR